MALWNKIKNVLIILWTWTKDMLKEVVKPKNFAKGFVLVLIVFISSYFIDNKILPHPDIKVDFSEDEKYLKIKFTNEGKIAGENVEIHILSDSEECKIITSLLENNEYSQDFSNFTIYPTNVRSEYAFESILKREIWRTGSTFNIFCPNNIKFKAIIGGKNFPSKEFKYP